MLLVDPGGGPMGQAVALVLAQDPALPPDKGPEFGEASPVGLVVILLLGIATMFLIRSMTKRLRRLPASFDEPAAVIRDDSQEPEPGDHLDARPRRKLE